MAKNIHGGGAKTNKNGLRFEQETSLKNAMEKQGYSFTPHDPKDKHVNVVYDVYLDGKLVGYSATKKALQTLLREEFGVEMSSVLSRCLEPDDAFFNTATGTLHIVEKKFQEKSGSVDEKLQTCAFKKAQYEKLSEASTTGNFENVEYDYILSDWFARDEYDDVKEFIEDNGCHYHIENLPMSSLGL